MLDNLQPEHTKALIYSGTAAVGGALGYVWRETRYGRKIRAVRVFLAAAMAAFISIHLGPVLIEVGIASNYIWALNGFMALLGAEFSTYVFERFILKRLGIDYERKAAQSLIDAGWTPPSVGSLERLHESQKGELGPEGAAGSVN